MKNRLLLILFSLTGFFSFGQVHNNSSDYSFKGSINLGTGGSSYSATAPSTWIQLGPLGTNKAMILPRVNDPSNIVTPADGMIIYDLGTNTTKIRVLGAWVELTTGSSSSFVPTSRLLTINGSSQSLAADRTWTITTTGTTNRISVTGGTGTTPTIDISAAYVGQTSITTLGTIGTGTWQGSAIADAYISTSGNWNTAYSDRLKWDGGATGLVPATGRTSLGGTTVGQNFFILTNPSAITFPRINADNSVSALDAATFRTAIGAGTGSGTVTSVAMTVPTGLTVSGSPVTSSGTLAVSLQSGYSIPTTASQTNWDAAYTNRITSLTVTGSSGAATLSSNVLNVPTYTLTGLGATQSHLSAGLVISGLNDGTIVASLPPFRGSANLELQGNGNFGAEINMHQFDYRYEVACLVAVHNDRYNNAYHQGSLASVWIQDTGLHKYSIWCLNAVWDSLQKETAVIAGSGYRGTVFNSNLYDGSDLPGMNRHRFKGYIQADSLDDGTGSDEYLVAWNQSDGKFRKAFPYTAGTNISINSSNVITALGVGSVTGTGAISSTGTPNVSVFILPNSITGSMVNTSTSLSFVGLTLSGTLAGAGANMTGTLSVSNTIKSTAGDLRTLLDGSNTAGSGAFLLTGNTAGDRFWLQQLNASNGLTSFYYDGSIYSQLYNISTSGIVTMYGTLNGTDASFSSSVTSGAGGMIMQKLSMKSTGGSPVCGNATLVGGTVTVSTGAVSSNSLVMLTRKTSGGTIGTAITYTISAGVSFTITSDNILDTSTFSWVVIEKY